MRATTSRRRAMSAERSSSVPVPRSLTAQFSIPAHLLQPGPACYGLVRYRSGRHGWRKYPRAIKGGRTLLDLLMHASRASRTPVG
jgi:hypothetical protein